MSVNRWTFYIKRCSRFTQVSTMKWTQSHNTYKVKYLISYVYWHLMVINIYDSRHIYYINIKVWYVCRQLNKNVSIQIYLNDYRQTFSNLHREHKKYSYTSRNDKSFQSLKKFLKETRHLQNLCKLFLQKSKVSAYFLTYRMNFPWKWLHAWASRFHEYFHVWLEYPGYY